MADGQNDNARACGPCTACCKPFTISEIEKNDGSWCRHAIKGKGCSIYRTRPDACRSFRCHWLQGFGRAQDRPDKAGFLVASGKSVSLGEDVVAHFAFYETRPGGLDTPYVREFIQLNVDGMNIVTTARMKGETTYERLTRFSKKFSASETEQIKTALEGTVS